MKQIKMREISKTQKKKSRSQAKTHLDKQVHFFRDLLNNQIKSFL